MMKDSNPWPDICAPARRFHSSLDGHSERGVSLIALLVAVGLLGIMAIVGMSAFKNSVDTMRALTVKSDFEDLRNYIRIGMDCSKTFAKQPCSGAIQIVSKGKDSRTLVAKNDAKLGVYFLKASCQVSEGMKFVKIKARRSAHDNWDELFTNVPLVCP